MRTSGIGGNRQILRGVDQGAVEVEDQKQAIGLHLCGRRDADEPSRDFVCVGEHSGLLEE